MDSFVDRSIKGSCPGIGRRPQVRRGAGGFVALMAACLLLVVPAASQAGKAGEMSKQAGLGAGSALTSLVYAPVKLVYAVGGLVVGGLAWCFSGGDNQVAEVVFTPSILGDYVVTPKQLTGEEPIEFFGRDPEYAEELEVAAAPVDDSYERAW